MTFKDIALSMWPFWGIGAVMLAATAAAGHKELIRIEKSAVLRWVKFLGIITIYRLLVFKLLAHFSMFGNSVQGASIIPIGATFTVFWEDACHGLPLVLLQMMIGTKTWLTKIINAVALGLVAASFGSGHVYQGTFAAMILMLYIPYSMKLGKKYGFGTVMVCHTLYDLSTIIAIKWALGSLF